MMPQSPSAVMERLQKFIPARFLDGADVTGEGVDTQYHIAVKMEEMLFRRTIAHLVVAAGFTLEDIDDITMDAAEQITGISISDGNQSKVNPKRVKRIQEILEDKAELAKIYALDDESRFKPDMESLK